MQAEIITIGDEILIGQIVDTNSYYIAGHLDKLGVKVVRQTSVRDEKNPIAKALKEADGKSDLVIVTGGLGPTKDDITKSVFCDFFEDKLVEDSKVAANIKRLLGIYQLNLPVPLNLQQALVPSKATVLMNFQGTAPGLWMETRNTVFVSLPGVPFEMRHLFEEEVIPRIIKKFKRPFIYHKTLVTYGMGESAIVERIKDWENALPPDVGLAYLPSVGRVRLRLSATGPDKEKLIVKIDSLMDELQELVSEAAVGFEDETSIVEQIGTILHSKKQSLSSAESCTGGQIASEIVRYPNISHFYKGGVIPYATEMKTRILNIPADFIDRYNVVSLEVAEAMAENCKKLFGTDYSIATTGIAGPTKGDGDKEVGTVCIAIGTPQGIISRQFNFGEDRSAILERATNKAFEMLRKEVLKN